MKKFIQLILLTLIVASCGSESGRFRLEGRFRNLNQGEFYVYSTGLDANGIDTIHVADGRFTYEKAITKPVTMMIVFPNFSEQPVFAQPGKTVKIKGDASHLKEMEITGTKDNELLTEFRLHANELTPPEVLKSVDLFISKNPTSPAALYLINKYLLTAQQPDYTKAYQLTSQMLQAKPDAEQVAQLNKELKKLKNGAMGATVPHFAAKDMNGKPVGRSFLNGKVNVVNVWASWNYNSISTLRRLKKLEKEYGSSLAIVSINLDATLYKCKQSIARDSLKWPIISDGKVWESPLLGVLGLQSVTANIVADKSGRIIARDLRPQELEDRIRQMMK